MTNNKLTDNEIIEAVKMCSKTKCRDCILCNDPCEIDYGGIEPFLVDLINRLQAENEKLENTLDDVLNREPILVERSEKYAKAEAYKEFAGLAVERVEKAKLKYQRLCKEQGEEMEEHMHIHFNGIIGIISNLLNELVGEDK